VVVADPGAEQVGGDAHAPVAADKVPPVVAVHAGYLRHAVELADLAGQIEAGVARGEGVVPLAGETGVRPDALVHGAPLDLRLGALAPPLLLVRVAPAGEPGQLKTLDNAER
jgi:hypothetical protein